MCENQWFPALEEYDPGITTDKWLELLTDKSIIGGDYVWARVLAVFYAENENAVPSILNRKYGYNGSLLQYCTYIAKNIRNLTNCPVYREKEYWAILFQSESPDIFIIFEINNLPQCLLSENVEIFITFFSFKFELHQNSRHFEILRKH